MIPLLQEIKTLLQRILFVLSFIAGLTLVGFLLVLATIK